jgi:MYXO-CTERM domain-containing protein
MATVVHQEAAHTWGLEHVNDETDNLHPVAGGFVDPKYRDTCNKIVSNTDLDPSGGQCNSVHTHPSVGCNSGYQNSYKEMLLLFGGPILDTVPPTVTIDSPAEGASLACPVNFDLVLTLSDDRLPASLDTAILLDGLEVAGQTYVNGTLTFPINGGISPGAHTFHVDIADESGNPASAEVHFTVQDNPADPECAQTGTSGTSGSSDGGSDTNVPTTSVGTAGVDGTGGGDDGCGCSAPRRAGPPVAAVALLVAATARRRRRAVS